MSNGQTLLPFEQDYGWETIPVKNASIRIMKSFLSQSDASWLMNDIMSSVPWRQDRITVFNKEYDIPRLQQWYGDPESDYVWSGIRMTPLEWTPGLRWVLGEVRSLVEEGFNSALINYYRNGSDTVGWHSDDETGLGSSPCIASLSLGEPRDFILRYKSEHSKKVKIRLTHGSLLVMSGGCQSFWQHSLPRRKNIDKPRINITFRRFAK